MEDWIIFKRYFLKYRWILGIILVLTGVTILISLGNKVPIWDTVVAILEFLGSVILITGSFALVGWCFFMFD